MGVRIQAWEWSNLGSSTSRSVNATPQTIDAGVPYDVFTGTVGNQTTIPAKAKPNEFVVIEDIGITPTNQSFLQITVNTTAYYQNPDGLPADGIPALASPYPCGASPYSNNQGGTGSSVSMSSYKLDPPLYILPGQKFSFEYKSMQGMSGGASNEGGTVGVMIFYTLYDGVDAMIANSLLSQNLPVTQNNVDWYKMNALANNVASLTMTGGR